MSFWWITGILAFLSAEDIKERQVSSAALLLLGCSGIPHILLDGHKPQPGPGVLLLLVGALSGEKVGYGDGWLLLALGMWLTLPKLLGLLLLGLALCLLYAACSGKKELPLIPFLAAAYVTGEILG